MSMTSLDLIKRITLAAAVAGLAACATPPGGATPEQAAETAQPAAAPVEAAPVPAAVQPALVGNYVGKWIVDGLGQSGKAELKITGVDGNKITGEATWFDTPFGDLTEPIEKSEIKADGSIYVHHANNAEYLLKPQGKRLVGNFKYEVYTGTLDVDKQ
ncbi:hypothetical protein ABWL39_17330 [Chitinivorax sp. PXF-14]|uniref:hypothetical protein n=1 Tax=Chitinivorax sp. PXF-14 TaxID=3230488 RepID=UPI0034651FD4